MSLSDHLVNIKEMENIQMLKHDGQKQIAISHLSDKT